MATQRDPLIDRLRFPLAVAVVCMHVNIWIDRGSLAALASLYAQGAVAYVLAPLAICIFFLMSGYLFFGGTWGGRAADGLKAWSWPTYGLKLRGRLRSLLVPYVVWIVLALLMHYALDAAMPAVRAGGPMPSLWQFWQDSGGWHAFYDARVYAARTHWLFGYALPTAIPYNPPMWFLRDLIVMTVCAPLFWLIVRRLRAAGLWLLGALYLVQLWPPYVGPTAGGVFWFCLGASIALRGGRLCDAFRPYARAATVAAALLFVPRLLARDAFAAALSPLFALCGVTAFLGRLTERTRLLPVSPLLAESGFFIFLVHPFVLVGVEGLLQRVPLGGALWSLASYVLAVAGTLSICLALFVAMRRFAPRLLSLLSGQRGLAPASAVVAQPDVPKQEIDNNTK